MAVIAHTTQFAKVVEDLTERFAKATKGLRNNTRGTQLHKWQSDFAYYVNEIVTGPVYIAPKIIDNANRYIDGIIKQRKEEAAQAA
jgi:hypothetical protein